jgi:hypothetical protein
VASLAFKVSGKKLEKSKLNPEAVPKNQISRNGTPIESGGHLGSKNEMTV